MLKNSACPLKAQCTPNQPTRTIDRHVHEAARGIACGIATTDAYVEASRRRKKVEMLFADLKRILRPDRLRLCGRNGASDEFHLAATAQDLWKLAKLIPRTACGLRELLHRARPAPPSDLPNDFFNTISR